jgi:Outer membrane protein beta-barrel domain
MRKLILAAIFVLPVLASAQDHMGSVKAGLFDPSATNAGFIIGYEGGVNIDENFFIGASIDWFNKNYVDGTLVSEFNDFNGLNSSLNELKATTNLHAIPIMGTVNGSWPIAPRMRAFLDASAGIEMLLIFYRNYQNPDNNEFKGAFDFAWQLGGGVAYEIGRRSEIFAELDYHNSQPSWDYTVQDNLGRQRVFERKYDMSGILFRIGFRFYY